MAVQPLNKTKIIKKQKKHPNRFASDKYKRVGVSHYCPFDNCVWNRPLGELLTVLIPESVVSSEATRLCPPLVIALLERLVTCWRMDSENCFSVTSKTLSCCWWTTEPTAVRSPTLSPPRPGKFTVPLFAFVISFHVLTPHCSQEGHRAESQRTQC